MKTFSIGFTDEAVNELPRARLIADRFSTDHHELIVEPDAVELLPKLVRHYGEPFGDHSALPCFYLAELAREHVTVALNGDGGDESFAGYQRYTLELARRPARASCRLRFARRSPRRAARLGESTDPRRLAQPGAAVHDPARPASGTALPPPGERLRRRRAQHPLHAGVRRAGWAPVDSQTRCCSSRGARPAARSLLDQLLEVDATVYLPGDLLTKIDIATMAYSLEARSPLLDHEFMELAASIPPEHKASGAQRKIALKGALRGWLPDAILDGRKQGFELPVVTLAADRPRAVYARGPARPAEHRPRLDRIGPRSRR